MPQSQPSAQSSSFKQSRFRWTTDPTFYPTARLAMEALAWRFHGQPGRWVERWVRRPPETRLFERGRLSRWLGLRHRIIGGVKCKSGIGSETELRHVSSSERCAASSERVNLLSRS